MVRFSRVLVFFLAMLFPTLGFGAYAFGFEGKWGLFRDGKGSEFACWVAAQTVTRSGPRRVLLFTVTKFFDSPPQVSIFSKKKSREVDSVYLLIGGREFVLDPNGSLAWPKKSDDAKIIKALSDLEEAGIGDVFIKWGSDHKNKVRVKGFNAAYQRNIAGCPTDR